MDGNAIHNLLSELVDLIKINQDNSHNAFDFQRDELLTADQVCDRLQITPRTLNNRLKTGTVPKPLIVCGSRRWSSFSITKRVYEDNPQLREHEHLLAEARRISCNNNQGSDAA